MNKPSIVIKYFPELSPKQVQDYNSLYELYSDLNSKINVISRKDIDSLYEKHVLHSLSIAKFVRFREKTQVLDVGTGGGFPGIPLAILFPETNFTLVDSVGKKIKVVEEVASMLGLKNVLPVNDRVENIRGEFDFIVSRAVTDFSTFYKWVNNKIKKENKHEIPNGILYLKGGDLEQELSAFKNKIKLINIADYFDEDFFQTKKIVYLPLR